jgi:phosphate transport system protein
MRAQFEGELKDITDQLVEMTRLVGSAVARATTALLDADLGLAEGVIAADQQLDQRSTALEEQVQVLLIRQQPVATDLRVLLTALRMGTELERMGDLAMHVAKLARLRYPHSAIPPELRGTIVQMGQVAEVIVAKAGSVIAGRDVAMAGELETDDDVMDAMHRSLFTMLLSDEWSYGVEAAVDVTLCSRYFERFADHAVSVARRVVFLVTGERSIEPAHGNGLPLAGHGTTTGTGAADPLG